MISATFSPSLAQLAPEAFGLGLGLGFLLLIGFFILLGLASFAFWLWMLVDCAQAPEPANDKNHRLVWILILVFTSWLGALLYFFIVRQPRLATARTGSHSSPPYPTPPVPRA
jgi:Phospholipase_D-nuclease N-terminal